MSTDKAPPNRFRALLFVAAAMLLFQIPTSPAETDLGVTPEQLAQAETQLQAELARLKAIGAPLNVAELAPPPVPDAENAAPLYLAAFAKLAKPAPPPPRGEPQVGPEAPPPGAPAAPLPRQPGPTTAELEQTVAANAEALALLHQAAEMPRCHLTVDSSRPYGLLPYGRELQRARTILGRQARLQARQGDPGAALRTLQVDLALADSVRDQPSVAYQDLRLGIAGVYTAYHLRVLLGVTAPRIFAPPPLPRGAPPPLPRGAHPPTAPTNAGTAPPEMAKADPDLDAASPETELPLPTEACRHLFDSLAAFQIDAPVARALLGQRALVMPVFDDIHKDPRGVAALMYPAGHPSEDDTLNVADLWTGPQGLQILAFDELTFLRGMDQVIAGERRGWPVWPLAVPRGCVISREWLYALESLAPMTQDTAKVQIGLSQVTLALTAYHNAKGEYPATLEALRAGVPWKLPLDPYSGRDFCYEGEGEGFTLYSVGPDLRDDGGAPENDTVHEDGVPTGDIVWVKDEG